MAWCSWRLDKLAMHPEADYPESLEDDIQYQLRLVLSCNDYSRQEVRAALRKIARSVKRHTSLAGPTGYLESIEEFVPL